MTPGDGGHLNSLPADDELRGGRRRYAGFVHSAEGVDPLDVVTCPAGHAVPRHEVAKYPEAGFYRCQHRAPPGNGQPCKRAMLVLFVHRVAKDSHHRHIRKLFVAEVDWREFKYLESQGIRDAFEVLAWLGEKYDPPTAR